MVTKEHFVTFFSPGTFFLEQTICLIESWDVLEACKLAGGIVERYGARPYGFRFETRLVSSPIDDGCGGTRSPVERSGMYYLNGVLETLAEIEARADPSENILRSNMRCNGWDYVVVTKNVYKSVHPFEAGDHIVDWKTGNILQ